MTSPIKKNEEKDQQEPYDWRTMPPRPLPKNDPLYKIGAVGGGTYTRGPSNDTKANNSNSESKKPEPNETY